MVKLNATFDEQVLNLVYTSYGLCNLATFGTGQGVRSRLHRCSIKGLKKWTQYYRRGPFQGSRLEGVHHPMHAHVTDLVP